MCRALGRSSLCAREPGGAAGEAAGNRRSGSSLPLASQHLLFLSVGNLCSPRVSVQELGISGMLPSWDPSISSPIPEEPAPGFPARLSTTCKTTNSRLSPGGSPASQRPGPRPLPASCGVQQSAPPPPPAGPPNLAPPPRPDRFVPGGRGCELRCLQGGESQGKRRGGVGIGQSAPRSHPCKYEHNGASPSLAPASKLETGFSLSGSPEDQ